MGILDFALPLAGYLLGSFPTGVVLSRARYGIDVREMGSGNIGATNITRNFGWSAGAITFLVDFIKGALPLLALRACAPEELWWQATMGTALVFGHCFSAFLGFRGGKGVATSLGCLAVVAPSVGMVTALVYAFVLTLTHISAVGSLAGILAAVSYVVAVPSEPAVSALTFSVASIVLIRHRTNVMRLAGELKSRRLDNQTPI